MTHAVGAARRLPYDGVLGSQGTGAMSCTAFTINNKIRVYTAGAQVLGLGKT